MRALGLLERLGLHLLGASQAQALAEALLPLLHAAVPAKCAPWSLIYLRFLHCQRVGSGKPLLCACNDLVGLAAATDPLPLSWTFGNR